MQIYNQDPKTEVGRKQYKKTRNLTNNPKQFWQHLKTLRVKFKYNSVDAIPPRQWIEHFSKLFNVEENIKNKLRKAPNPKFVRENFTLDSPFSADKVSKGIAQLKNKKASGHDSFSNEMIKTGSPAILPFLVTLFNTIYTRNKELPRVLVMWNYYSNL